MNLGDIITRLETANPNQVVPHGFHNPHSYRGDYYDLAFEPTTNITIADMLEAARSAVGTTYQGYKGGDFKMTASDWCWLSEEGSASGETISPLLLEFMLRPENAVPADTAQLQAAARRGLDALAMLILDNPDPGTEALGAQYELRQALTGQSPEFPAIRVWQIQAQRRDGSWNDYSAPHVDGAEAHGDFAVVVAGVGHTRAFQLVSSVTTQTVEAVHTPEEA